MYFFQLACATISSQEGQDYLKGMAAAANYAWVNRSTMTFLSRQVGTKNSTKPSLKQASTALYCMVISFVLISRPLQKFFNQRQMILTCILFMMYHTTLQKWKNTYPLTKQSRLFN